MSMSKLKRRKQERTNYTRRLGMIKSGKPRLVVRISNKYITVQIIEFGREGDKTETSVNSKELAKYKWKAGKNIPSAYLTGYLLAKKTKVKHAIMDAGIRKPHAGGKIYAVLKGVVDGGIKIPHDEKIFPPENRISGKHISEQVSKEFEKVKSQLEEKK